MAAERRDEGYDTEITLGTGKMLALFFGLVILCAVFFGMGFSMGRNSVKATAELLPSPSESARPAANRGETPTASTPVAQSAPTATVQTSAENAAQPNPAPSAPSTDPSQAAGAASQPNAGFYVQVAAVSKQEDAEALVDSLKGHQYQAFIANQPSDKLFHVQVGPFTDVKEAEAMRTKLVNDGYNPILKK